MAKSKWDAIKENLALIEKWARDGLTEAQIAKNLRVGKTTFEKYKKEKPELSKALKEGKRPFLVEVENALSKRALGFTQEEKKTYIKDDGGKMVRYTETTEKYFPPDVAACFIILKNKDRDDEGKAKWSSNPAKLDIEKEMLEIKRQLEEMKLF